MITEPEEIRGQWKNYIEMLYDKEGKPLQDQMQVECESLINEDFKDPRLLNSEIMAAVKEIKNNKAVGIDDIPIEIWKAIGEKGMKELLDLCKDIYEQGLWPDDFTRGIVIPIPKKVNAVECEDHRTINLICHASKIILRILTKRIESKAREYIGQNQFGFRK